MICSFCRYQNLGGSWAEWVWYPNPITSPWRHSIWSPVKGRGDFDRNNFLMAQWLWTLPWPASLELRGNFLSSTQYVHLFTSSRIPSSICVLPPFSWVIFPTFTDILALHWRRQTHAATIAAWPWRVPLTAVGMRCTPASELPGSPWGQLWRCLGLHTEHWGKLQLSAGIDARDSSSGICIQSWLVTAGNYWRSRKYIP